MSRIDQLISQYCPAGVPMVRLGELMTRSRKKSAGEKASVYTVSNSLGLIPSDSLHDFSVYSADTSNYLIVKKGMFAYNPARLNIGSIACMQDEIGLVSPMYVVFSIDSSRILERYMYYTVKSSEVNFAVNGMTEEGARFRFDFDKWNKITIPLPPLPVQEEIVRILDAMSDLVTNLDAEISARQKQYEYARETLLTFGEEVERKALGEVCGKVKRGKRLTKSQLTETDLYPVYHGGNMPIGYYHEYNREANTVMIINVGASAGTVGFCDKKFWSSDGCFCINKTKGINDKYLYNALVIIESEIKSGVRNAGIPTLDNSIVENLSIPLPSLSVQQSIVERLDKMESLIQNLKAERALRQKQYEYYREKLLTF